MKTKNSNLIGISGKIGSGKNSVATIIQGLNSSLDRDVIVHHVQTNKPFSESSGYKQVAFADKLKDMVCILIGCTREQLEDREFKEKELGEEWWYYTNSLFFNKDTKLVPYTSASKKIQDNTSWYIIKLTPRKLLQLLGTDCGRNMIHPNIWINALMSEYKEKFISSGIGNFHDPRPSYKSIGFPKWIITDLRFENELKAIEDRGGITIRVNRPKPIGDVKFEGTQEEWGELVKRNKINNERFNHPSETALDNAEFNYIIDNDGTIEELIEKVKQILIKEQIL